MKKLKKQLQVAKLDKQAQKSIKGGMPQFECSDGMRKYLTGKCAYHWYECNI